MIRPYKTADKTSLIEILRLNTPQYFNESEEADFIKYLDHHREEYFVIEANEKIVGSGGINYFPKTKSARISWDIIHPDFQGKGLGKELLAYRVQLLKKHPSVQLIVVRTSQFVHPFYEKMGFELEKIEKDYWASGIDLYQMKLPA